MVTKKTFMGKDRNFADAFRSSCSDGLSPAVERQLKPAAPIHITCTKWYDEFFTYYREGIRLR